MTTENEILLAMSAAVGRIMMDCQSAPRDDEGWLEWANEVVPILPGIRMRRCVYHINIVGPAMAFVLRGRRARGEEPNDDPMWQAMLQASKVTSHLVSLYDQEGNEINFEGWIEEMAKLDGPVYYDSGSNWQLHTEYHGLDIRLPDEVFEEEPLPVYLSTLCDGDGEPLEDVPGRASATRIEALRVHTEWVAELRETTRDA